MAVITALGLLPLLLPRHSTSTRISTIRNLLGFSHYRYRLVDSSRALPRGRRQQLAKKTSAMANC
jgi:hypothetical protein